MEEEQLQEDKVMKVFNSVAEENKQEYATVYAFAFSYVEMFLNDDNLLSLLHPSIFVSPVVELNSSRYSMWTNIRPSGSFVLILACWEE